MGRKPDPRARILGPYAHHGKWRIISIGDDGRERRRVFESRLAAEQYKATLEKKISTIIHTTQTSLDTWVKEMKERGLSPRTIEGYEWAVRIFWPDDIALRSITKDACAARYETLVGELAVDSHRNCLKMCKTFLRWCIKRGWLAVSPLAELEGIGKKKKGKPQLRITEARKFFQLALERAGAGDQGAIAALMCLVLTLRSESEALSVTARDLDDDGHILWVADSKTEAGKRGEEVPDELRPALLALAKGKGGDTPLFRRRDRKWLWDEVKRLCADAGVPRVSPHALRGMHASISTRVGATSRMVAEALGHAGDQVTKEHYIDRAEARRAEQRAAMKVLKGGRE